MQYPELCTPIQGTLYNLTHRKITSNLTAARHSGSQNLTTVAFGWCKLHRVRLFLM